MNGDELGSRVAFLRRGRFAAAIPFAIGSAGRLYAGAANRLPARSGLPMVHPVEVHGGTHNQAAPSIDFICRVWEPLLARMGISRRATLIKHSFYPAGGGAAATVVGTGGTSLRGLTLISRGETRRITARLLALGASPRWRALKSQRWKPTSRWRKTSLRWKAARAEQLNAVALVIQSSS